MPTPSIHREIMNIFMNNKQWADGELLERFFYYNNNPNPSTFHMLCALINSRYDSYCRRLGIPVRTYVYRRDKKQFENSKSQLTFLIKKVLIFFLILLFMAVLYYIITLFYERFFYPAVSPLFYLAAVLLLVFMFDKLIFRVL